MAMEATAVDTTARGLLMLSPRLRLDTAAMAMAVGMAAMAATGVAAMDTDTARGLLML